MTSSSVDSSIGWLWLKKCDEFGKAMAQFPHVDFSFCLKLFPFVNKSIYSLH